MKLYLAEWCDGSVSVVSAENKRDLFDRLDSEGDPLGAIITEVNLQDAPIHLNLSANGNKVTWDLGQDSAESKTKEVKLSQKNNYVFN